MICSTRFLTFLAAIFLGAALLLGLAGPAVPEQTLRSNMYNIPVNPGNPLQVGVGIKIDQITSVDQKSENYGAVVRIRAEWHEPLLAFDREKFGRDVRIMDPSFVAAEANEVGAIIPAFVVENQQSNRWIHEAAVGLRYDGYITYVEKSSLTLQAPYFNFLKYPLDTQNFYFEVVSVLPQDFVHYYPLHEYSGLGDLLGEEEWILENARLETRTVTGLSGQDSDMIALAFEGRRHITYYVIRVFMPMLVLVTVSWSLFFLDEYRKRIEIAGANLLVFIAFNWAISADLPKLGYLTFLDFILQWMFVVTGAIVVVNVILRRIKAGGRPELAHKIDTYVIKWVYPLLYAAIVGFAIFNFLIKG